MKAYFLLPLVIMGALSISLFKFTSTDIHSRQTMDLSGTWNVTLDSENEWIKKANGKAKTQGNIDLPGSLAENSYGFKTSGSDYGILTPEYRYIGKSWYTKMIDIPKAWEGKTMILFLERVLWESTIILDGVEVSVQDGLGTPHVHELGQIPPGSHTLTIRIDNEMIHNIGDKGHAYGDYTQSIWNGIVGRLQLSALDPTYIKHIRTIPHVDEDQLEIEVDVLSQITATADLKLEISLPDAIENIIEYEKKCS